MRESLGNVAGDARAERAEPVGLAGRRRAGRAPAAERRDALAGKLPAKLLLEVFPTREAELSKQAQHGLRADAGGAGEARHRSEAAAGVMLDQMARGALLLGGEPGPAIAQRQEDGVLPAGNDVAVIRIWHVACFSSPGSFVPA